MKWIKHIESSNAQENRIGSSFKLLLFIILEYVTDLTTCSHFYQWTWWVKTLFCALSAITQKLFCVFLQFACGISQWRWIEAPTATTPNMR